MAGIRLDKLRFYAIFFKGILVAVDSSCIKLFNFYKIPQKLKWLGKTVSPVKHYETSEIPLVPYICLCKDTYMWTYIIKIKY